MRVNPLIHLDARACKVLHKRIFIESISGVTNRIFVVGSTFLPESVKIHGAVWRGGGGGLLFVVPVPLSSLLRFQNRPKQFDGGSTDTQRYSLLMSEAVYCTP